MLVLGRAMGHHLPTDLRQGFDDGLDGDRHRATATSATWATVLLDQKYQTKTMGKW